MSVSSLNVADVDKVELHNVTVLFLRLPHTLTHMFPCSFEHFIRGQMSGGISIVTQVQICSPRKLKHSLLKSDAGFVALGNAVKHF